MFSIRKHNLILMVVVAAGFFGISNSTVAQGPSCSGFSKHMLTDYFELKSEGREAREKLLVSIANRDECREQLISELRRFGTEEHFVNAPTADNDKFQTWEQFNRFILQIHGIELADFLLERLEFKHVLTDDVKGYTPAELTLIAFGKDAIPIISSRFSSLLGPSVRLRLVYCLYGIGGIEAQEAMRLALQKEETPLVCDALMYYLDRLVHEGIGASK